MASVSVCARGSEGRERNTKRFMPSLTFGVVSGTDKTQTATYGSDGSRLGGWTIMNEPAQKTARFHHLFIKNEYIFDV